MLSLGLNTIYTTESNTKVNGKLHKERTIKCRVPNGSILALLLFLVCDNDLAAYLGDCKTSLYAEVTVVYFRSSSYIGIILALRTEASNII